MPALRITRRDSLEWMAASAVSLVVTPTIGLASGPGAIGRAPSSFTVLEIRTVNRLGRVTYPFSKLSDDFYARAAGQYLEETAANAQALTLLKSGLARLNGSQIAEFTDLPPLIQIEVLTENDNLPFFQAFKWRMAEIVFRSRQLWALVGYQGSSLQYGGYLHRGFNDISWLPKV